MEEENELQPQEQPLAELKNTKVELTLKQDNDGIIAFDIGLFFKYFRSRWFSLAIALGVALLVGVLAAAGYRFFGTDITGEVSLVYNLSFKGIDEGKNPWGGTYIASEAITAEVLSKAIDKSDINNGKSGNGIITVEDIRQNLSVQGILSDDVMNRVLAINELIKDDPTRIVELTGMQYYPVQYKMTLELPKDFGLDEEKAKNFLNTVITEYYEWFIRTYGDFSFIATIYEDVDFDKYDYAEQLQICRNSISAIVSYLTVKDRTRPDFVSPSKGIKFTDLLLRADFLRTVDADDISSLIYTFSLTKDKIRLLAIYDARLSSYGLELTANLQTLSALNNAITNYERQQTTFLMPSVSGGEGTSFQSDNYSEYDALTRQKVEANKVIIETQRKIDDLNDRVKRLSSEVTVSDIDKAVYTEVVENAIKKLVDDVNYLSELTNIVAEEYYATYEFRDGVRLTVPAQYFEAISFMKLIVICGIVTIGLLFIVFVRLSVKAFFYVNRHQHAEFSKKAA